MITAIIGSLYVNYDNCSKSNSTVLTYFRTYLLLGCWVVVSSVNLVHACAFSRTLHLHCNVQLLSYYVVCRLSVWYASVLWQQTLL